MTQQQIREKIERLVRLAERPGTKEEGETARRRAIELSNKYGVPCKFTSQTKSQPPYMNRQPGTGPISRATQQEAEDILMNRWVVALNGFGWSIKELVQTKVGRQLRFRKPGFHSEIRVTQRKNSDGQDFEAEHVLFPDPDQNGQDNSYTTYMCMSLGQLLAHISYTKDMGVEPKPHVRDPKPHLRWH